MSVDIQESRFNPYYGLGDATRREEQLAQMWRARERSGRPSAPPSGR